MFSRACASPRLAAASSDLAQAAVVQGELQRHVQQAQCQRHREADQIILEIERDRARPQQHDHEAASRRSPSASVGHSPDARSGGSCRIPQKRQPTPIVAAQGA
jgi:hypothetical protein